MKKSDARGVIVTAKGNEVDFVSRFFGPQVGVDEDPVTGSAHTSLTPYWSKKLGKTEMTALQLSKRKGHSGASTWVTGLRSAGKQPHYLVGEITI